MNYQEQGKVIYIGDIVRGVSSRTGEEWQSQTIVIETQERFPRRIAGDITIPKHIAAHGLRLGEIVTVVVDISAHEHNARWYHDHRIVDVLSNNVSRFVDGSLLAAAASPN